MFVLYEETYLMMYFLWPVILPGTFDSLNPGLKPGQNPGNKPELD